MTRINVYNSGKKKLVFWEIKIETKYYFLIEVIPLKYKIKQYFYFFVCMNVTNSNVAKSALNINRICSKIHVKEVFKMGTLTSTYQLQGYIISQKISLFLLSELNLHVQKTNIHVDVNLFYDPLVKKNSSAYI